MQEVSIKMKKILCLQIEVYNLRLGSVYGYSTDTMKINIVPNLFSKITSKWDNQTICRRQTIKKFS